MEREQFIEFMKFLEKDTLFFIDEVRKWLRQYDNKEISFSKFVELFNEKVFIKYGQPLPGDTVVYIESTIDKEQPKDYASVKWIDDVTWLKSIPLSSLRNEEIQKLKEERDRYKEALDNIPKQIAQKLASPSITINELCDVLQNTCQLLLGIKPDAINEKWWSEWDESVLVSLVNLLKKAQPYYDKSISSQPTENNL